MKQNKQGWLPILSASMLLTFWLFFAAFLPMTEPYVNWVLDSDWTWINTIGFIGSAVGVFSIYSIYQKISTRGGTEHIALAMAIIGVIVLTSILFFESFILKGIALENKSLIDLNNSFYSYKPFRIANLAGGILFSLGIILLGVRMIQMKTFKRWSLIVLMIGCPLFGIMIVPGNFRLLGVLLYAIAFISIGIQMLKGKKVKP